MLGKMVGGIAGGLIVAFLGMMNLAIVTAPTGGAGSPVVFYGLLAAALIVAWKAPDAGKCWRWLLLGAAVLSFTLPLASMVFTGWQVAEIGDQAGTAGAAGAAVGGGIFAAITGFAGFFLGAIFLVLGLLSGREKTVIVVEANAVSPRR